MSFSLAFSTFSTSRVGILRFVLCVNLCKMAFVGVEYDATSDDKGAEIALVHKNWITPRKLEAFWPPYKAQAKYRLSLKEGEEPDDSTWPLYSIKRKLFETDDYEDALRKLRKAEVFSDVQSEPEAKRKRNAPIRYSSSDDDTDETQLLNQSKIPRPPRHNFKSKSSSTTEGSSFRSSPISTVTNDETFLCQNNNLSSTSANNTPHSTPVPLHTANITSLLRDTTNELRDKDPCLDGFPKGSYQSMVKLQVKIFEQNKQILTILENYLQPQVSLLDITCGDVQLPLQNLKQVEHLEDILKNEEKYTSLVTRLSKLGGKGITAKTNKILRSVLTYALASEFN